MRDDLLDAGAAVEWAVTQLPVLADKIAAWRETRPYSTYREFDPERGKDALKVRVHHELPRTINAEVGAIINSIRSSLDMLATALAERNGHVAPEDVYFPVAATFESWRDSGEKKIARLSIVDQTIIKSLQPYHGRNDPNRPEPLYLLHRFDIVRKHRRLIEVREGLGRLNLSGLGIEAEFLDGGIPALKNEAVLAWISPAATNYQLTLTPEIFIRHPTGLPRFVLQNSLIEFCDLVKSIIQRFNGP